MVKAESLGTGAALHSQAFKSGYDTDVSVANALVDMYVKCGSLAEARKVFDGMTPQDPVSWNALILGYGRQMGDGRLVKVEEALEKAVGIHARAASFDLDSDTFLASALVSFYAKCGSIRDAWKVFQRYLQVWTQDDPVVANGVVDGYGKAGDAAKAQQVFESLEKPDAVAWTSVIAAHSRDGDTRMVFKLFDEMQDEGFQPDGIALLCVLTACSHGGLVRQAKCYFKEMEAKYGVCPGAEHYQCMVDALGRANELEEAVEMVKAMPCEASGVAWRTVLGACKQWKNAAVGKLAFYRLVEVEARHEAGFKLVEGRRAPCLLGYRILCKRSSPPTARPSKSIAFVSARANPASGRQQHCSGSVPQNDEPRLPAQPLDEFPAPRAHDKLVQALFLQKNESERYVFCSKDWRVYVAGRYHLW
ncbi:putative pentatricopeptide repeat-containing protein At1g68930 [Selaginella moellendorffii]|uniref:putative pentatricopeptide repeat-containing protein At1g68930 n=1 Tax=Selaginella moellendorffii TaxID=88036 RepID=UPI000D1C387F|nr:putative pentatricopeptide repeat-containing protein At1g68930 [Selaginella moellendorffii]|eukprot:XP_024539656.1 putative pentatricopeptide repeat-containing protein At1g68930 [Selaginella moellendorffii]